MGLFGDCFRKTIHVQVISDTDGSFDMYIDPDVFKNMQYLISGSNVFRIKSILALDKAVDDFDAVIHVDHFSSYHSFFNKE